MEFNGVSTSQSWEGQIVLRVPLPGINSTVPASISESRCLISSDQAASIS